MYLPVHSQQQAQIRDDIKDEAEIAAFCQSEYMVLRYLGLFEGRAAEKMTVYLDDKGLESKKRIVLF